MKSSVPYDPFKTFEPISLAAIAPEVIVVNPSVPAKTVKELLELVKANPGKYSYASPAMERRRTWPANACSGFRTARTLCTCHSREVRPQ